MAKNGPAPPKRPRVGPKREILPESVVSEARDPGDGRRHNTPDPHILAKEEKVRQEFQTVFGHNLKSARLKSGLKQSEVAVLTGLTQQYLSLIEAGQQNLTLKTMILLAEVVDGDLLDMLKRALEDPTL